MVDILRGGDLWHDYAWRGHPAHAFGIIHGGVETAVRRDPAID